MHRVTEEEAKKRCFVGLHIRPDRHKSYNKRDASEKQEGTHEQPTSTAGITPNIVTVDGGAHASEGLFPDLRGLSARDALRTLSRLGMSARLNGTGVVVRQLPEAGAPIDRDTSSTLWLERQLAATP